MFYSDVDLICEDIYLSIKGTFTPDSHSQQPPGYRFTIHRCIDRQPVGECTLQLDQDNILDYLGHIGFVIFSDYRGHGYATKATKLLMVPAKKHNMTHLLVMCHEENLASAKSIINAGGQYIENIMQQDYESQDPVATAIYRIELS